MRRTARGHAPVHFGAPWPIGADEHAHLVRRLLPLRDVSVLGVRIVARPPDPLARSQTPTLAWCFRQQQTLVIFTSFITLSSVLRRLLARFEETEVERRKCERRDARSLHRCPRRGRRLHNRRASELQPDEGFTPYAPIAANL